jgi:transmembrane sensor
MIGNDEGGSWSSVDREASGWLTRLRAGNSADQKPFEDWYSADPAHADAYDRVLATWQATSGLVQPSTRTILQRPAWHYGLASLAAVLLLVVGLNVFHRPSGSAAAKSLSAETRIGEVRVVDLSDGSRITLDTQSAIQATFSAAQRQVRLLRGRAHFDVADQPRPFVIDAGSASVQTSGAAADVSFYDGMTRVGVQRGTADVFPSSQNGNALARITAGRVVTFGQGGQLGPALGLPASEGRWVNGMLAFDKADLATVIATANRYSQSHITLADPALGALKVTGTFKADDLPATARMIAAMFGLQCDESDPREFVLSRTNG